MFDDSFDDSCEQCCDERELMESLENLPNESKVIMLSYKLENWGLCPTYETMEKILSDLIGPDEFRDAVYLATETGVVNLKDCESDGKKVMCIKVDRKFR